MFRYFILLTAFAGLMWAQAAKNWKDRAEYDLYEAATKATDANKALEALNTWKQKYAETDYKEERAGLLMVTYQKLNQGENMLRAALDWHAINPKAPQPMYWCTLLTLSLQNAAADRLDSGQKCARALLSYTETELAPAKKPDAVSAADWDKQRLTMTTHALKTLTWIEVARKNHAGIESEATRFLKTNPNRGVVSSWLANALVSQKVTEKQETAMFHFARAGWYTGEDELPADVKKQIQAFFTKTYTSFHGSEEGMKDIIALALKSPFPPGDFDIKSKEEIAAERRNKLIAENPQLAFWIEMKERLQGEAGYWDALKETAVGQAMKGKVVSQTPERKPNVITVAISDGATGELKLVLDTPMANPAEPGTEIEFKDGIAKAFTPDPFLLTFEIEKANVTGWPAPARTTGKGAGKGKGK